MMNTVAAIEILRQLVIDHGGPDSNEALAFILEGTESCEEAAKEVAKAVWIHAQKRRFSWTAESMENVIRNTLSSINYKPATPALIPETRGRSSKYDAKLSKLIPGGDPISVRTETERHSILLRASNIGMLVKSRKVNGKYNIWRVR